MTWRPRWTLRFFLGFFLFAGCVAGLWGRHELQRQREVKAIKAFAAQGVSFQFGDIAIRSPKDAGRSRATAAYFYEQNQSNSTFDLTPIRELRHLKTLHFGCTTIKRDSVRHLESLPRLEELHLSYFPVDDEMLKSIGKISSLRHLHIDNSQMTAKGIEHLVALRKLKKLDIQTMNQPAIGLDGAGKYLGQMTSLEELSLKANLTTEGLYGLSRLKNLRFLDLQVPQIKVEHIEGLTNCPQLSGLSIYHVNRGNKTLAAIAKLSGLTFLSCGLGRADDVGMHHLKSLTKLEKVELRHSAATEQVAEILRDLPSLQQIQLGFPAMRGGKATFGGQPRPPWPAGANGSGIYERTKEGDFKELTNAEIAKRG